MAESSNSKRVIFPKGEQKIFTERVLDKISTKDAARISKVSERTIRDWRREKFSMDLIALRSLCKQTRLSFPKNVELRDRFWYIKYGSSFGGKAVLKKYGHIGGDPNYRKKMWYAWWEREGKHRHNAVTARKPIHKPQYSIDLAEFVGILLGDGCISSQQVTITLHENDDKEYAQFVVSMVQRLFNVPVGIHNKKGCLAVNYIISRSELVRYCTEYLGLKIGNKVRQQVDIPDWIRQRSSYEKACVRGLFDTDGCVFTHRYQSNKKWYSYHKLSFTSASKPLRTSVYAIFKNSGLTPRYAGNRDVRLDSALNVKNYFKIFGTHNPKHLKRYTK